VPFANEQLTAYELGFKFAFPAQRLQVSTAAFYYDYKDMQVFTFVNTGTIP
jgi:iron complex outermembrane recepter protein